MQHITKLCADNLRVISNNHGIKLKASHAHELVAAFFGYKSRAALLADTSHPLSKLRKASTIILHPTDSIEERRKNIQDLPPDLPDNYTLGEWVYTPLINEKWIINKIWSHPKQLAIFHADEYLRLNKPHKAYKHPVSDGVSVENINDLAMRLTIGRFYQIPMMNGTLREENITMTIKIKRIAGHIGYSSPKISVTTEAHIKNQN